MADSAITYATRSDVTPEAEISALAACYKLLLDNAKKKEAAPESRPEDERNDQDALTYTDCT